MLAEEVREAHISGRKPHREESILQLLLHKKVLSYREAAEVLTETFEDYSVSFETVRRGKKEVGLRDPVTDGPFADVLEGGDTEPGQPPKFFVDRSNENPAHPAETDHYCVETFEGNGVEMIPSERDESPSITPHFTPSPQSDSPTSTPESTNSASRSVTGVYKPPTDPSPRDWRVNRSDRDTSLVAPPWVALNGNLPKKYHACGCGHCEEKHFFDGNGGSIDCPRPVPVTIAGARQIYQKAEGSNYANNVVGGDVQRGQQQYARLMKADSEALNVADDGTVARGRTDYGQITTVLLSLRLSATDTNGRLVTPYTLVQDLKDSWAEARQKRPRDIGERLAAYFWTFAGTDEWATPHVHSYLWYYDPDNAVREDHFEGVVRRFVEVATFPAKQETHFVDDDPTNDLVDGPVRVEHTPLLADPERLQTRIDSGPFDDILGNLTGPKRLTEGGNAQSQGALYVGTQLPNLALLGGRT